MKLMFTSSLVKSASALALVACSLASAAATPPSVPSTLPSPGASSAPALRPTRDLTAADAEAWLDGLMPTALHTGEVPGAVVVVVKDGQILVQKGYGFSNHEKRTPVDSRTTLFRPGSVSKLFTWTAVMQLVEQGKLDLDADVNTYLDFKIPARDGQSLTLRQIMKHTSGFEESAKNLLTYGETGVSLESVLKGYIPPRMFAPGSTPGYSNYATGLAGYIVQRVSGLMFDDYIDQHIFKPLEMRHSSFRQPLPQDMRPNMSVGYKTRDKPGEGFEIVNMPPAGSLTATGEDMGHFMISHLQHGRFGSAQILKPETARLMHESVTRSLPDLNGIALGFYQQNINGRRVVAHGGDTVYFHSDLLLFLDDHVGLFVSVNAPGKDGQGAFLRDQLFHEFADRYLPGTETSARVDPATARAHAKLIAGRYIGTRRADSTFLSLVQLLSPTTIEANPDGTISAAPYGPPRKYVETGPFLWHEVGGHDRLQAIVKDGKVSRWSTDAVAFAFAYEPAGGLAQMGAELPLAIAALGLLALTALSWPFAVASRRYYKAGFPLIGHRALAYRLLRVAAVLSLVAVGLWARIFTLLEDAVSNLAALVFSAQAVSLLAFGGGLIAALWNVVLTFRAGSGWFARIFAVLLAMAFAITLWIALSYHLVGFKSNY
jgi:CubicO group peptidase (beta-lactamase class C family)